jgi:hypothetical protein
MRRIGIIAVLSLIVAAIAAVPALAVPPTDIDRTGGLHFVGQPNVTATFDDNTSFLTATGEVAGAGPSATATLSADALVTRGCVTPSGSNRPRGLERTREFTLGEQTFETRSGRGSFNVSTDPITLEGFGCPSANMEPVLVSVRYTNITLTVTSQTGTTTATFPDIRVP